MPTLRPRTRLTVITLAGAAALAACSSGGSSSRGSSTREASSSVAPATSAAPTSSSAAPTAPAAGVAHVCSLLPIADAARITGIALQPELDSARQCSYDRADSTEHLAVVTVALDSGPTQPHQYDFNRSHPIGSDVPVDVAGVGDKAFYSPGFRMLVTLKGENMLHVSITDTHVADPKAVDVTIARLVFDNLG